MLVEIRELLNSAQVEKLREVVDRVGFVDGRATAGMAASRVKSNEELASDPEAVSMVNRILMSALGHHAEFRRAALPNRLADFIIARYHPGMTYGDHVDDPIMGGGKFRTDVSMTVFLNPPDAYDGGELVVRTTFGEKRVKLGVGDAVVYPSASVHHVAEVTRGERLVALTWIQSFVRDAARRELLYELDLAREHLLKSNPDADTTKYVDRSYANLLRMWGDL